MSLGERSGLTSVVIRLLHWNRLQLLLRIRYLRWLSGNLSTRDRSWRPHRRLVKS
nr:MAG TPA: hypothetical protein [Caudoviricetes sp.]